VRSCLPHRKTRPHRLLAGRFGGREQGIADQFGQVLGVPTHPLFDLGVAAESVGEYAHGVLCCTNGGEKYAFPCGDGDIVLTAPVPEGEGLFVPCLQA
jgi:hypothetical protein